MVKEQKTNMKNSSADPKKIIQVSEIERIKKARSNMLKSLRIPKRYKDKDFSNFDISKLSNQNGASLINDIKHYSRTAMSIANKNNWAFLTGGFGLGKTHLAIAAFKEAACQWATYIALKNINPYNVGRPDIGRNFHFVTSSDLVQEIRDSYDSDLISEHGTLLKYKESPLLLLDDLGTEKASDWQQEKLHIILNHRYNYQLPTIITTNLGTDRLKTQINQRLMDRIVEATNGGQNIWQLSGKSYRQITG